MGCEAAGGRGTKTRARQAESRGEWMGPRARQGRGLFWEEAHGRLDCPDSGRKDGTGPGEEDTEFPESSGKPLEGFQ